MEIWMISYLYLLHRNGAYIPAVSTISVGFILVKVKEIHFYNFYCFSYPLRDSLDF